MIILGKRGRKVFLTSNPKFTNYLLVSRSHSITIAISCNMSSVKKKTAARIFELFFLKAANIVGQCRIACFAIVLEKHTCTGENLVFPYLNTPFKTVEYFYQELFMEVAIVTSHLPVIC